MEWHEETITDLFLLAARPYVMFETFSKHQESSTGADWLWWWVSTSTSGVGGRGGRTMKPRRSGLACLPTRHGLI